MMHAYINWNSLRLLNNETNFNHIFVFFFFGTPYEHFYSVCIPLEMEILLNPPQFFFFHYSTLYTCLFHTFSILFSKPFVVIFFSLLFSTNFCCAQYGFSHSSSSIKQKKRPKKMQ